MPCGGGGLDASILELGLRHPPQAGPPRDHAALAAAEGSLSAAPAVDAVLRLMAQGYSSPPGRSVTVPTPPLAAALDVLPDVTEIAHLSYGDT